MSLNLSQITHRFGATTAVNSVSFALQSGEQVALIGPSGCGKTTLLRIIGTQLLPTEGEISLLGQSPDTLSAREIRQLRTRVAVIPQHLGLVSNVSVLRNVLNGGLGKMNLLQTARQVVHPTRHETQRVYELLRRTGIEEKIYDRTDSLSGGQQQRVALARALYQQPSIILADEPVSSIDPARARNTIAMLKQLSLEEGITLIVSLHNLELAREFFPRLIGLRSGGIVFDSPPDELSQNDCQALFKIDSDPHRQDV
jgi:phosphonate transport system ATP-binding protein